jgi:formate hydrogenlyase transcriptional activator
MFKPEQKKRMNYHLRPVGEGFGLEGTHDNAARAKLLLDFNHAVVSQLDLDSLLKLIFTSAQEMFQQTIAATLSIHDVEKDELRIHLLHSDDPELFHEGMPLPLEGSPSGLAFSTRQTVLINRVVYEDFPSKLIERAIADGIKSGCSVPLVSHNRVVGALTVGAAEEGAYSAADAELLTQIGAQIAMPIENALNFRMAQRERDRNRLLLEVNNAVASNLDLRQLLRAITSCLREVMPHDATGLAIWDENIKQLRMHAVQANDPGPIAEGQPIPMEGTPSGLAFKTGQTVRRDRNDFEEFYSPYFRKMIEAIGLKCGCNVPLKVQDRVIGVLSLGSYKEAAFTQQDVNLLEAIASQLAIAVENAVNFQRAERERDRKRLLLDINNAVISHVDLKDLVKAVSATLRDIMPHDSAGIALYEPAINQLREYTNVSYKDLDAFREGETIPLEGTPAGQVFVTGEPMLIMAPNPELYPADRYSRVPVEGSPKSACLALLMAHGRKLGIVGVSSTQLNKFTEADLELFVQVAGQIGIAVQNTLNFERANREGKRAQMLLEINNAITSNLELHELIRATSVCLHSYFNHDFAGMSLYDEETNQLMVHSLDSSQPDKFLLEGAFFPIEGSLNGLAFTSRQPLVRNRIDPNESSWPLAKKFFEEQRLKSACFIPMISAGRTVGVLNLGSRIEDAFSEENVELLVHIAGQIAIAVQNSVNFDRATKAKERTQILLEANNAIATSLNLRDLLTTTSACLRTYFDHDVAGLSLYDDTKKKLIVHVMDRNDHFTREGTAMPLEGTPMSLAFTSGRPVLRGKVDFDEFPAPEMKAAYDDGWRSGCIVPLIAHDRTLGVLGLASFREEAFNKADANLLQSIAGQVALAVENTLQFREIESLKNKIASEKLYLEEEIKTQYNFGEIVGESSPLKEVLRQVETVAPTDSTVLLIGETGTGKELIARAIHNLSGRHERTLVKLNCAAIPTGLLESELFGHEKGAFTGAIAQRVGRFELAHKGTLLLDEIGEIPLELQPKLLRVLQEHEFERLGSSRTVKTDARLIAATNCDLEQMVEERKFRSDLFYRLNVFPIVIPPLRERTGDIPLLVGYFAQKHAARMNKKIETIPTETMDALCDYRWPGNVRELENFIERSVILSQGSDLKSPLAELQRVDEVQSNTQAAPAKTQLTTMDEMERAYIEEVLRHTNGSIGGKDGAAEVLGMPASTLRGRMKKLGIR